MLHVKPKFTIVTCQKAMYCIKKIFHNPHNVDKFIDFGLSTIISKAHPMRSQIGLKHY